MNNNKHEQIFKILRFMPLILCLAFMALYIFYGDSITVESLSNFAPKNTLFAALFLLLLYAVKSLSILFPFVILNMVGGLLFPTGTAVIVNFLGLMVELAVPYWVGRASGSGFAENLRKKHPKLDDFVNHQPGSKYFMTFFLRAINCLPTDAVSMYYGAVKLPFGVFMLCSFFGCMPLVLAVTLLGASITDTSSPMFWISIALTVSISLTSLLTYFFWQKHKKKINNTKDGE